MHFLDNELTGVGGFMPMTRINGNAVTVGIARPVTQQLLAYYLEKYGDPDWSIAND